MREGEEATWPPPPQAQRLFLLLRRRLLCRLLRCCFLRCHEYSTPLLVQNGETVMRDIAEFGQSVKSSRHNFFRSADKEATASGSGPHDCHVNSRHSDARSASA